MQNSRKLNDNAVKQIAFLLYLLYSFIVNSTQILYISSLDIVYNFEIAIVLAKIETLQET